MFNWFVEHFGPWFWYHHSGCEYEQIKYSVFTLNLVMIVTVICALVWGMRYKRFNAGLTTDAWRVTTALLLGLCGWVLQYILDLHTFHPGPACYFPKDLSEHPVAKYGVPLFSSGVSVAFFFAGSYLLQLNERFHTALGSPTTRGIQLKTLSAFLGNERARGSFILIELIVIWFQWSAPEGRPAIWLDSLGNCASHVAFGLGLLRELNRERREFVGMASALSMLLYGGVQLTSLKAELFFDGYILAAFLKFALLLTMLSFGAMIQQILRTRLEGSVLGRQAERKDLVELLVTLNFTLRHDLTQPLQPLDPLVALLADKLPVGGANLVSLVQKALKSAEDFFKDWPEGLNPKCVNLKEFLEERRFTIETSGSHDVCDVVAPPLFVGWAMDRLRENALAAKADKVTVSLRRTRNEHNEPVVLARITSNGQQIPENVTLFKKPHGTWVARRLMELANGKVELEFSGLQQTVFRIELPAAKSAPARARTLKAGA